MFLPNEYVVLLRCLDKAVMGGGVLKKKCIICEKYKELSEFSLEHIIPEALGNKHLILREAVCKSCNILLGDKIDSELTNNALAQMYRQLNKLPGKKGKIPNPFSKGVTADGRPISVNENFKPHLLKTEINIHEIDETSAKIHVAGGNFDEMIKAVNKKFKRMGKPILSDDAIEKVREICNIKQELPEISYSFEIDVNKIKLAALKIAYEVGYLYYGERYLDDQTAKEIRAILYDYIYHDKLIVELSEYVQMFPKEGMPDMNGLRAHFLQSHQTSDGVVLAVLIDRIYFFGVRFLSNNEIAKPPIAEVFLYENNDENEEGSLCNLKT